MTDQNIVGIGSNIGGLNNDVSSPTVRSQVQSTTPSLYGMQHTRGHTPSSKIGKTQQSEMREVVSNPNRIILQPPEKRVSKSTQSNSDDLILKGMQTDPGLDITQQTPGGPEEVEDEKDSKNDSGSKDDSGNNNNVNQQNQLQNQDDVLDSHIEEEETTKKCCDSCEIL